MSGQARFSVGLDLGTTHCVISTARLAEDGAPQVVPITRVTAPGQTSSELTLPSVLHAPLGGEFPGLAPDAWLVGDYARRRGRELPKRTISSAKSWLCHPRVERTAAILPWGSDEGPKLSPVEASARLLASLRDAFEQAYPGELLAQQSVILTVPASFDPTARELTLQAARQLGLQVRLLEEPQAAFYDFMQREGIESLFASVESPQASRRVLVCDVGGGTTDLTLLEVRRDAAGTLSVERTAVGAHLLLGGDNIDRAIAHQLEARLAGERDSLEASEFVELTLACRELKEQLLSADAPTEGVVTLGRRGSALVGSTRSARVTREELEAWVLDGFLPPVERECAVPRRRAALVGLGLPYESDPAITRHIAAFLARHLSPEQRIDALLFNGGPFRSARFTQRLLDALEPLLGASPLVLPQPHPELAVARGAALFGRALSGRGRRIGGGSAHGYFVGLELQGQSSVRPRGVCVVPRGAREGEPHRAELPGLSLRLGELVRFELYSTDCGPLHAAGQVVELGDEFELVAPLAAELGAGPKGAALPVLLEGELSAVGTLELHCVGRGEGPLAGKRFALAFELRGQEPELRPSVAPSVAPGRSAMAEAQEAISRVFGKGRSGVEPRETKELFRKLDKLLGPRARWSLELNRQLLDELSRGLKARRRTPDHERIFWQLAGFLLRPGFGFPLDRTRVRHLASVLGEGLAFPDEIRGWQQFFIAWRRLAGGMDTAEQSLLCERLQPVLSPRAERRKGNVKPWRPLAEPELLECVAALERLELRERTALGETLLERTWTKRDPGLFAALGRIGARVPLYAGAHHVVPPRQVEVWLDHLLRERWDELPSIAKAAAWMARVTGERSLDVSESLREEVALRLERHGAPELWVRGVRQWLPVDEAEQIARFGEELPVGLCWSPDDD